SGAKAGIAIGCVAGAALVAGLLYLLFRERRKSRALQGTQPHNAPEQREQGGLFEHYKPADSTGPVVLPQQPQEMGVYDQAQGKWHMRGEMDGGQGIPQELSGQRGSQLG
ncbi:MAG: hypothetical protein LQ352_008420, partial [Teloschistes flavicans]